MTSYSPNWTCIIKINETLLVFTVNFCFNVVFILLTISSDHICHISIKT